MLSQLTGGTGPTPPNPGAVALGLAPHLFLIAAAMLAIYLWRRRDARHRPAALGLAATAGAEVVRYVLSLTVLAAAGPHEGLLRAVFHLDQGLYLVGVVVLPWMALSTLCDLPPGPTQQERYLARLSLWLVLLGAFGATWSLLVLGYPELRGDALRRVYLGAELATLFVCALAIAAWVRRRMSSSRRQAATGAEYAEALAAGANGEPLPPSRLPRWYTLAVVLGLVLADAALLFVGAWPRGLFGSAYAVQQGGLLVLYVSLTGVHAVALALTRPR